MDTGRGGGAQDGTAGTGPGFACFGKLPGAGDFITRRMPYTLQQFWDRWCASGMEALKERNPASGWAVWGSTPKWGFLLPAQPGVPIGQLGVLAPSCDRVGRVYPFLVTTPVLTGDVAATISRAGAIALAWCQVIAEIQFARNTIESADAALGYALRQELANPAPAPDADVTLPPGASPLSLPWPDLADVFDVNGGESYWWSVPPGTTGFRARTHSGPLSGTLFLNLCS
ncbi:MAG: type VI secretion system-associated protein TagF [Burkholderiales bacterium]|nr:type VI secretion system-associated protein TagF [Burkholderiales bacterium]